MYKHDFKMLCTPTYGCYHISFFPLLKLMVFQELCSQKKLFIIKSVQCIVNKQTNVL